MPVPMDALQAVTHADPEVFYKRLAPQSFQYSSSLKSWIAASFNDVSVVLHDPRCRVRPPSEPVPSVLVNSQAGEIFGRLVRMTDSKQHRQIKEALISVLNSFSDDTIYLQAQVAAQSLVAVHPTEFAFQMPVRTTALLLGMPATELDELGQLVERFAACIAPGSPISQVEAGKGVAPILWQLVQAHLSDHFAPTLPQNLRVANAIGLLWQGYDSTASLILHGFLSWSHQPLPENWAPFLTELVRRVTPIQNTRRFMAEDGVLLGHEVKAGDTILLVLAAANHEMQGVGVSFGHGIHRCPGQRLALLIVEVALNLRLASERTVLRQIGFKPSLNARIPLLEART